MKRGLFKPYLIRKGLVDINWGAQDPREWHGNPILAILRSRAIASGLERLPHADGGVPDHVAQMYLELVGLYGTPDPAGAEGTITVADPGSIRVIIPPEELKPITPAVDRKRRMSTEEVTDRRSNSGSAVMSQMTGQSHRVFRNVRTKQTMIDNIFLKRRHHLLESVAATDETGGTSLTITAPETRAAKRARLEAPELVPRLVAELSARSIADWVDENDGIVLKQGAGNVVVK